MAQLSESNSVWRPSVALRLAATAFAIGSLVASASIVAIAATEGAWLQGLAFVAAFFVLPATIGLRYALRARLELADENLVIVTTFSEHRIAWIDVHSAQPEYAGIRVYLRDGSSLLSGAVQKSNGAVWLKRRTRADEVADLIERRAIGSGAYDG